MPKKWTIPLLALALALPVVLSGCIQKEAEQGRPIGTKYDMMMSDELVNASNTFAFDLYPYLDTGGNVFYSPYSITIALGMAYEGARGLTATEMAEVLKLPVNDSERHSLFRSVQSRINDPSQKFELSTANAYWLRQGEHPKKEYIDILKDYYLAHGEELDFWGDPDGAADTINEWVEEQTHDMIKDILSPDALYEAYLVLTNAIYFKGQWTYEFDKNATEEEYFLNASGSETRADMMKMCDEEIDLFYGEKDGLKMLELPYKGDELSMFIVLPTDRDADPSSLRMTEGEFARLHDSMHAEWVDLWLPKFEFEQKYFMNSVLKDMGMPTAFDPDADFSGIKQPKDGGLYISDVIHQSFVKVDEEGTEAAAATAVVMSEGAGIGGSEPQPVEFHADHPFMFIIQHKATGQFLFMGKVEDPLV